MDRFRIGDRIHVIHIGNKEVQTCTILDILEDYGGNSYWLKNDSGSLSLEIETPETAFEKIGIAYLSKNLPIVQNTIDMN